MRIVFRIIEERNCSLYKEGELFQLSEKTLGCPGGKDVCLILCRDMTELLFTLLQGNAGGNSADKRHIYHCSGCTGLIKFTPTEPQVFSGTGAKGGVDTVHLAVRAKCGKIVDSSFLRVFPPAKITSILENFSEISLEEGDILIREGEKNQNLYIIVDGELDVLDGEVSLATLKEGDLCGEMSYLGAEFAVATVKAVKKTRALVIPGALFYRVLGDNQDVQSYMARLLAKRLKKTNVVRTSNFESSMSGRIDHIAPAELLQIFHMHQKTGVLDLDLPEGEGKVVFREGAIIDARYGNFIREEAIYTILAQRRGLYRFSAGLSPNEDSAEEIGDFMMLLMEGIQRIDEDMEEQPTEL